MAWGGIHPLVQVVLGASLGYAVAKYFESRQDENNDDGMGIVPNFRYGSRPRVHQGRKRYR